MNSICSLIRSDIKSSHLYIHYNELLFDYTQGREWFTKVVTTDPDVISALADGIQSLLSRIDHLERRCRELELELASYEPWPEEDEE